MRSGEPERVPAIEIIVDPEIRRAWLASDLAKRRSGWKPPTEDPDDQNIRFWYEAGYDYVRIITRIPFVDKTADAADTASDHNRGNRGWRPGHLGIIQNWQEFESYAWPDIRTTNFGNIEHAAKIKPDGMLVIPTISGVFEHASWLMGLENFSLAIVDEPDLVEAIIERVGSYLLEVAQGLASIEGVGAIWLADDLGSNAATLISPRLLRKYVFPWHKRISAAVHQQDLPLILHSCGNLRQIFDDLIDDIKIDALHSLQPNIYDIAELKQQIGHRVALLGNVDVDLLATGEPEQIRRQVRYLLDEIAPGGGFAVSSSNSIANYCKLENFVAMLDEVASQ